MIDDNRSPASMRRLEVAQSTTQLVASVLGVAIQVVAAASTVRSVVRSRRAARPRCG